MERMRLFVGLPMPEAAKQSLAGLVDRLRPLARSRLGWTRPEGWHITLAFLGDVAPDRFDGLTQALAAVRFCAFTVKPGGAGCFPGCTRPRVLYVGLDQGHAQCAALAAAIRKVLTPLGFAAAARPFTPHLTLARVRTLAQGEDWAALQAKAAAHAWPSARMDRFVLWRSFLGPGASQTPRPADDYVALAEYAPTLAEE